MNSPVPSSQQSLAFKFHGRGGEFFRVWIVNIALSVITIGIYSAWAKVRTHRYFYDHTLVGKDRFSYLANPVAILKGRLIAVGAFLVYSVLSGIPVVGLILGLALTVVTPWFIVRAIRFGARVSAFRNIRFDFKGRIGEAALLFVLGPLLMVLSLGLATPWLTYRFQRFLVQNYALGKAGFSFNSRLKDYYVIYTKTGLLLVATILTVGFLTYAAFPNLAQIGALMVQSAQMEQSSDADGYEDTTEPDVPAPSPSEMVQPENTDDPAYNEADATADNDNDVITLEDSDTTDMPMDRPNAAQLKMIPAIIILALWVLFFVSGTYLNTALANLMWNNTTLGSFRFESRLRWGDMLWLRLSNLVAIVITLGLFIPWAKVRLAHYRAQSLSLLGAGNLDGFIAERTAEGSAMGEEVSDVFDLDVGSV